MIAWFKSRWEARGKALAEKDRQVQAFYKDALEVIALREDQIQSYKAMLDEYSDTLHARDKILNDKKQDLVDRADHLSTVAAFLEKTQKDIDGQKEAMLGRDSLEIKKSILLPEMKKKWEAEARLLDAQRAKILVQTPKIYLSLHSRREELANQIMTTKQKPATMGNHNLLVQWEAKLQEINELVDMIDKERDAHAPILTDSITA